MPAVRLLRAGSSYVVRTRSTPEVGLGSRFGCFPRLYLDGLPMSCDEEPFMIDNLLTPDHIEAVEVYANGSQAPAQYGGFGSSCGVVLIWTRR